MYLILARNIQPLLSLAGQLWQSFLFFRYVNSIYIFSIKLLVHHDILGNCLLIHSAFRTPTSMVLVFGFSNIWNWRRLSKMYLQYIQNLNVSCDFFFPGVFLILLSIFDTINFHTAHAVFVFIFIGLATITLLLNLQALLLFIQRQPVMHS